MRISDWSSDVCSSDLSLGLDAPRGDEGIEVRDVVCDPAAELGVGRPHALDSPVLQGARRHWPQVGSSLALAKPARLDLYDVALGNHAAPQRNPDTTNGRASCRERGCQYG